MISQALLGGSFDPVHNGHLHIAREILCSGLVENVIFLPNARHNFKGSSVLLDYTARRQLIAAVLEPRMELWDDDSEGSGYTSDLLKRLCQAYPDRAFLWVIGSDNLSTLHLWHDFPWLRSNVHFLIIPRPDFPADNKVLKRIRHKTLKTIPSDISSSDIRSRIRAGKPIHGLVPPGIEDRVIQLYLPLAITNGS